MSPLQLPAPVSRKEESEADRLQKLRAGSKKRTRAYNPEAVAVAEAEAVAVAVPKRCRESV
jgi:hypothetical protein